MNFKDWFERNIDENMWGNIPCKTRKPSDGWGGKATDGGMMPQGQMPANPKMMRKMKKK